MSEIKYSGQARIAADHAHRNRRLVAIWRKELRAATLPTDRRLELLDRIDRYEQEAELIEAEIGKYLGASA